MDPAVQRPSRRRPILIGCGIVAALLVGVWMWWPAIARDPQRVDVVVVGTGQVGEADQSIQRRIREEGQSVEMVRIDPCTDTAGSLAALTEHRPSVVVLSTTDPAACAERWETLLGDAADAAGGNPTLIVLTQTGQTTLPGDIAGQAVVADPSRLLGDSSVTRIGCQWWDDCEPDGQVTIRTAEGSLTPAGAERVARVLVGTIP